MTGCYDRWRDAMRTAAEAKVGVAARLTFTALASFTDEAGRCWPSVPLLEELTGLDRRRVQRSLRELETAGLVGVEDDSPGQRRTYHLLFGAISTTRGARAAPPDQQPAAPVPPTRGARAAPTRGARAAPPAAPVPPEVSLKNQVERTKKGLERQLRLDGAEDLASIRAARDRMLAETRAAPPTDPVAWAALAAGIGELLRPSPPIETWAVDPAWVHELLAPARAQLSRKTKPA